MYKKRLNYLCPDVIYMISNINYFDYRYDASGNQISQIGTVDKQQRSFNGLNQLVQINVNGKLTQYEYDALGRRSAKITELGRTDFIWDNHQLIGECTLAEYTWFIYQPDTFTPVALIKSGQVYYYHLVQLGTPICLTDENNQIVWRSQQDVFGQTIEGLDFEVGIMSMLIIQLCKTKLLTQSVFKANTLMTNQGYTTIVLGTTALSKLDLYTKTLFVWWAV
ncbi:MAG: hypothetical protein COW76_01075 [Shewanella sp. CG18_big_fil_WC_8_21_14_2_50_42_11]|nr:MAG: hypothetical protein COW76_01075 [Shewanella sp. CG18_big_fil_WC_8_21_14_2_50_42_11]